VRAVGVVVLVAAQDITIKTTPEGAHVVFRRGLSKWLGRQPDVLEQEVVDRIFEVARRSTTWQG
jgi:hypothetical protein